MVNPIRFGGIASGLDTESLVKQLVAAERTRVDKITQQSIYKTWQQEQFNSLNKSTANFIIESRKKLELTRTTSNGSLLAGSYQNMSWVNKATSSNESSFSVTATAAASPGSYGISVENLAKGVTIASDGNVDAIDIGALNSGNSMEIRIKANSSAEFSNIILDAGDTMSQAAKKISDATGLNVKFDAGSKRFFMSTSTTGTDAKIEFDLSGAGLDTQAFLEKIKFTSVATPLPAINTGTNAKIIFQGATIEYQSNNINILGIDINLTSAAPGVIEQLNVSTDINGAVDKIKEFVDEYNKLIDTMNGKVNEKQYRDYRPLTDEQKAAMKEEDIKLWEQKAKSGLLRGDSNISSMLGTMRNGLYQSVDDMVLVDSVTGKYDSVVGTRSYLYEFGITTGSYRDNGKLTIDENKLRKALTDNPDKVIKTLFKSSSITEEVISSEDSLDDRKRKQTINDARRQDSGVFTRLYDDMISGMKSIVDKSGPGDDATLLRSVKSNILIDFVTQGSRSMLDKDLLDIAKSLDRENARLAQVEQRYWDKFTALETAMQRMNNQSSWLSQQLGGGMQ